MKQLTANEILSISRLLQMEANGLTITKASLNVITDDQLKALTQTGITASETRIRGIQQFINENNIITTGEVQ